MLKIGDHAPDFTAQATNGSTVSLAAPARPPGGRLLFSGRRSRWDAPTRRATFATTTSAFGSSGAEIIGISADKFDQQCRFASENKAPFPLVGDEDKRICEAFGVLWPLIKIPQRTTFVIDEQGVVRAVFHHEVQISRHLDDVREFLETRAARAT